MIDMLGVKADLFHSFLLSRYLLGLALWFDRIVNSVRYQMDAELLYS